MLSKERDDVKLEDIERDFVNFMGINDSQNEHGSSTRSHTYVIKHPISNEEIEFENLTPLVPIAPFNKTNAKPDYFDAVEYLRVEKKRRGQTAAQGF